MSLENGTYIISNKANDLYIGRHTVEDRSLLPKRVLTLTLPAGVQAPKVVLPSWRVADSFADLPIEWLVEKLSDGVYKLSTRGGNATEIDEKVFAVLLPEPEPTEWSIKLRENHGPNVYTVEAPSGNGWVIPEEEPETQVAVKPLTATRSLPPQFPPNELFTFERVDSD